jgi:quinol monooxygenase YgiN
MPFVLPRSLKWIIAATALLRPVPAPAQSAEMLVRVSEIEIEAAHLAEYTTILKAEAEASVRLEPGVLAIFPMYQKDEPTQIRILEIYSSHAAYELHLKSAHFQRYKTSTLHMVRSLKLVDMSVIDAETMTKIFRKTP